MLASFLTRYYTIQKLYEISNEVLCICMAKVAVKLLWVKVGGPKQDENGYLLHCMHKQQDFFGCLAEILGCLGLREAANLEI